MWLKIKTQTRLKNRLLVKWCLKMFVQKHAMHILSSWSIDSRRRDIIHRSCTWATNKTTKIDKLMSKIRQICEKHSTNSDSSLEAWESICIDNFLCHPTSYCGPHLKFTIYMRFAFSTSSAYHYFDLKTIVGWWGILEFGNRQLAWLEQETSHYQ